MDGSSAYIIYNVASDTKYTAWVIKEAALGPSAMGPNCTSNSLLAQWQNMSKTSRRQRDDEHHFYNKNSHSLYYQIKV